MVRPRRGEQQASHWRRSSTLLPPTTTSSATAAGAEQSARFGGKSGRSRPLVHRPKCIPQRYRRAGQDAHPGRAERRAQGAASAGPAERRGTSRTRAQHPGHIGTSVGRPRGDTARDRSGGLRRNSAAGLRASARLLRLIVTNLLDRDYAASARSTSTGRGGAVRGFDAGLSPEVALSVRWRRARSGGGDGGVRNATSPAVTRCYLSPPGRESGSARHSVSALRRLTDETYMSTGIGAHRSVVAAVCARAWRTGPQPSASPPRRGRP